MFGETSPERSSAAAPVRGARRVAALARGVGAPAFLAAALALLAAGCGGTSRAEDGSLHGSRLTIYTSMPLGGADGAVARDLVRAQRLALAHDGGRIGRYRVRLVALDATTPKAQRWDPSQISQNARRAARDPTAVAYVGELHSGSSAISIPLLNEAGILEVSPLDSALALTTRSAEVTGSPVRYYPNAREVGRTFARVVPSDRVQARAQLAYMEREEVRRLAILTDDDPAGLALAGVVRNEAAAHGIAVVANEEVDEHAREHRDLIARLLPLRLDAVLYAGGAGEDGVAARLWRELGDAAPALKLFAPAALADAGFVAALGASGATAYVTRPLPPPTARPPAARRFARAFAARFGVRPVPEAVYGYEAMRAVLAAIRRATRAGGGATLTRADVVRAFFATRIHRSVLGPYAIDHNGDTSLRTYGAFRVVGGRWRFERAGIGSASLE